MVFTYKFHCTFTVQLETCSELLELRPCQDQGQSDINSEVSGLNSETIQYCCLNFGHPVSLVGSGFTIFTEIEVKMSIPTCILI